MIRIVVAEDHAIVREGVCLILEAQSDMEIVGEAVDGRQAVDLACELAPDVVIMDLNLPEIDGMEATRRIRARCPTVRVLALTVHDTDEYFLEMIRAGAAGYVLKGAASEELVRAVRAVVAGDAFLHPSVARHLLDDYAKKRSPPDAAPTDHPALTPRELEILSLVGKGRTNRAIAIELVISPSTVQTHVGHIMEKLDLGNRSELIHYAIRHGLVEDGDR